MNATLPLCRTADFLLFQGLSQPDLQRTEHSEYQQPPSYPRSIVYAPLTSYSAILPPGSPHSSSGSSHSDASPDTDSPALVPFDEFDISHAGGLVYDSFESGMKYISALNVPQLESNNVERAVDLDSSLMVKPEYEPAALFDPIHLTAEHDIAALSPYFYHQQLSDDVHHMSEMQSPFGFADQYNTLSADLQPDGPDPTCDNNGHASQAAASSTYNVAQSLFGVHQERHHVQVEDQPPSCVYDTTEPVSRYEEQSCDPRFVNSIHEDASSVLDATITPVLETGRAMPSSSAASSPEEDESSYDGDTYCESDVSDEDEDKEFTMKHIVSRTRRSTTAHEPGLSPDSAQCDTTSANPNPLSTRRITNPVPVPNLTKKSRGRRVPTVSTVASHGGISKNTRTYMCIVEGCGKCFARGEHLKRHVRSIHTNEKPHRCPHPGCGKDFSRHDNLGQHMRTHKSYQS